LFTTDLRQKLLTGYPFTSEHNLLSPRDNLIFQFLKDKRFFQDTYFEDERNISIAFP